MPVWVHDTDRAQRDSYVFSVGDDMSRCRQLRVAGSEEESEIFSRSAINKVFISKLHDFLECVTAANMHAGRADAQRGY